MSYAFSNETHEVGEEVGVGGGGQQICIAEVTCVVLVAGGPGVRRFSD
jgi:hypothetical protein